MATHRSTPRDDARPLGEQLKEKLGLNHPTTERILHNCGQAAEVGLYIGVFIGTAAVFGAIGNRIADAIKGTSD